VLVVAVLAGIFLFSSHTHALSVAPATIDLGAVVPGERYTTAFVFRSERAMPLLLEGSCYTSPTHIEVKAGSHQYNLFVMIPDAEPSGTRSCTIRFRTETSSFMAVALNVVVSYQTNRTEIHNVSVHKTTYRTEQGLPFVGEITIHNTGNVLEHVMPVIEFKDTSFFCPATTLFPYQRHRCAFVFKSPLFIANESLQVHLADESYILPVQVLPIGALLAEGEISAWMNCSDDKLHLLGTFTNTGYLGGAVDVLFEDTQVRQLRAVPDQMQNFSFATDHACKRFNTTVTAKMYGQKIAETHVSYLPPPSRMIRISGHMVSLAKTTAGTAILGGLCTLSIIIAGFFFVKKFIYKN
jgi:hypothetical protein